MYDVTSSLFGDIHFLTKRRRYVCERWWQVQNTVWLLHHKVINSRKKLRNFTAFFEMEVSLRENLRLNYALLPLLCWTYRDFNECKKRGFSCWLILNNKKKDTHQQRATQLDAFIDIKHRTNISLKCVLKTANWK